MRFFQLENSFLHHQQKSVFLIPKTLCSMMSLSQIKIRKHPLLLATQSIFQIAHSQSLLEIFWKDCTQISPFKQFIAHSLEQGFLYIGLRKMTILSEKCLLKMMKGLLF